VNVLNDAAWSLQAQAGKTVLLAFSGITWCGPCQAEAPGLQAVWQDFQSNTMFTMAIISGTFSGEENPASLMSAISNFGITFPVVPGATYWDNYDVGGVPTLYCLKWNAAQNRHDVGAVHVGAMNKDGIVAFLADCGVEPKSDPLGKQVWAAVWLMLFGGVGADGGGIGITPGGKPVPIGPWDPLRYLGPAGRDTLVGLAMAEMSGRIEDRALRERARKNGIETARAAVEKLARSEATMLEGNTREPLAWGPEDQKRVAAEKKR
jgi:thiol-disulfide isomerase/thioredoxin